uniref:Uncharacterized protein n=1 Tax=Arundo donax TaxID=35708 RepID=A0A0A9B1Q7_ARUDO
MRIAVHFPTNCQILGVSGHCLIFGYAASPSNY